MNLRDWLFSTVAALLFRSSAPPAAPTPQPLPIVPRKRGISDMAKDTARGTAVPLELYTTRAATPEAMQRLFTPALPPPGVVPEGTRPMAMDDNSWSGFFGGGYSGYYTENLHWMGYPYLAELTQRSEYRKISETVAREMTRRWFKLVATGEDDKGDKIKQLEAAIDKHKLQAKFKRLAELDGYFGRAHLYIDTGYTEDRETLRLPLIVDPRVIKKGSLKEIRVIEPVWCYPGNYNANDPLMPDFYVPKTWYVMAREIHRSRLLTFVSREMPDLFKPAYAFGGMSMSQMAKPYIDNWLRTRQSISDMVHSFSTPVLATDMGAILTGGGSEAEINRAAIFNNLRDNLSIFMINKESEEFSNVAAPLGTLDHLQAQAQEQMASVSGTPLIVLLGITPSGLNASSEGELQVWSQYVHASQTTFFNENLITILQLLQLDLFGEIDPEITHSWEPLEELNAKERDEATKSQADTDAIYVNAGILSPDEIRQKLSGEPESPYQGLDLDSPAPTPPEQEQDPLGGGGGGAPPGGAPGGAGQDPAGGRPYEPGTTVPSLGGPKKGAGDAPLGEGMPAPAPVVPKPEHTIIRPGENDKVHITPKPGDVVHLKVAQDGSIDVYDAEGNRVGPFGAFDADFEEEQHPRGEGGKFSKSRSYSKASPPKSAALHGVPFQSWAAPKDAAGWKAEAAKTPKFDEPELPKLPPGKHQGAGVIIQEPDGHTWVVHPTNQYGGYSATFPKGTVDQGDSMHATAIKEAYEESGLHVQLTGYAGDAQRDTSQARYYYAKRIGGTPADHGWESEKVTLSSPDELHHHLNKPLDRRLAIATIKGAHKEAPINAGAMKKTGGQLGSNPGGKFRDPADGKEYYVKDSKSDSHAKNEILASRLYDAAGAPAVHVMPATTQAGKLGTATEWHDTQKINPASPKDRQDAQKHFAAHAWLANWDAPGLTHDNQARIGGQMHTLDSGGALLYRAQGGAKGAAFGDQANEWESMRHPVAGMAPNKQAHELFGGMSPSQLKESAGRVARIPDSHIRNATMRLGPGSHEERTALAERLIARRNDIAKRAGLAVGDAAMDAALPEDAAAFAAFDAMIGEWEEAAHPRDEEGKFTSGGAPGPAAAEAHAEAVAEAAPAKPAFVGQIGTGKYHTAAVSKIVAALNAGDPEKIKELAETYKHEQVKLFAKKALAYHEKYGAPEAGAVAAPEVEKPKSKAAGIAELNSLVAELGEGSVAEKPPELSATAKALAHIDSVANGEGSYPEKMAKLQSLSNSAHSPAEKDAAEAAILDLQMSETPEEAAEPSQEWQAAQAQAIFEGPSEKAVKIATLNGIAADPNTPGNVKVLAKGYLSELEAAEPGAPSEAEMEQMAAAEDPMAASYAVSQQIVDIGQSTDISKDAKLALLAAMAEKHPEHADQAKAWMEEIEEGSAGGTAPAKEQYTGDPDYLEKLFGEGEAEPDLPAGIQPPDQTDPIQVAIHKVATGENTPDKKMALIADLKAGMGLQAEMYGDQWIEHFEAQQGEIEESWKTTEPDPLITNYINSVVNEASPYATKMAKLQNIANNTDNHPQHIAEAEGAMEQLAENWQPEEPVTPVMTPEGEIEQIGKIATASYMTPADKIKAIEQLYPSEVASPEGKAFKESWLKSLKTAAGEQPSQPESAFSASEMDEMNAINDIVDNKNLAPHEKAYAINQKINQTGGVSANVKQMATEELQKLGATPAAPAAPPPPPPKPPPYPPNYSSAPQKQMYQVAKNTAMTHAEKMSAITKLGHKKQKPTKDYAWQLKQHLIAEKHGQIVQAAQPTATPAAPAAKPVPAPLMASSSTQMAMHAIATGPGTDKEKAEMLLDNAQFQSQLQKSPTGTTAQYANQLLETLGYPTLPGVPKAEPLPPLPPPKPEAMTLAQKAAAAAPPTAKHGSLTAKPHVQVTQARKGPQLSFALKAESEARHPASTSSPEALEIVPSMNSSFWAETAKKDQAAFSSYGGGGYHIINGVLRGHDKPTPESLQKIDAMHAIMESPEVRITGDKPLLMVRGEDMSDAQRKDIKDALDKGVGTHHYMRTGFSSGSLGGSEISPGIKASPGYKAGANTWWVFTVMPGAKVLGLAGNVGHHEREVVLPHGISTEIYEMYHDGHRHIIKAIVR